MKTNAQHLTLNWFLTDEKSLPCVCLPVYPSSSSVYRQVFSVEPKGLSSKIESFDICYAFKCHITHSPHPLYHLVVAIKFYACIHTHIHINCIYVFILILLHQSMEIVIYSIDKEFMAMTGKGPFQINGRLRLVLRRHHIKSEASGIPGRGMAYPHKTNRSQHLETAHAPPHTPSYIPLYSSPPLR